MILKGRSLAVERELELAMFTAWQTARITNYGGDKLRSFNSYLKELRPAAPRAPQSRAEMIAALRAIKAQTTH